MRRARRHKLERRRLRGRVEELERTVAWLRAAVRQLEARWPPSTDRGALDRVRARAGDFL